MSRKLLTQKKRHTKPCKYFQVNKCPHPADVCDFAHVLISPVIASPVGHSGLSACRYYYGQCMNGAMCNCRRTNNGRDLAVSTGLYYDQPWSPTSLEATYSDSPPPMYNGFSPFSPTWSPTSYSLSSPFSAITDAVPSRSRDSMCTISTTLSSGDSEDSVVTTEDPQYTEHHHEHQSQICVVDDSPVIHVPPFQPFPYMSVANLPSASLRYYSQTHPKLNGSILPPSLKPRNKISKQKALKYKTKPCKFFPTDRGCPNGASCNFIHDEPHLTTILTPKETKEDSSKEDASRKNFVPIPWRVIGGGVLVGVQKEEGDVSTTPSERDDTQIAKNKKTVGPLKIIVTRKRSNSIPPTPSITQVNVGHLFSSAESPGVL